MAISDEEKDNIEFDKKDGKICNLRINYSRVDLPELDERQSKNLEHLLKNEYFVKRNEGEVVKKLFDLQRENKLGKSLKIGTVYKGKSFELIDRDVEDSLNKLKIVFGAVNLKYKDSDKFTRVSFLKLCYLWMANIMAYQESLSQERRNSELKKLEDYFLSNKENLVCGSSSYKEIKKKLEKEYHKPGDFFNNVTFEDMKKDIKDEKVDMILSPGMDRSRNFGAININSNQVLGLLILDEANRIDFKSVIKSDRYPVLKKLVSDSQYFHSKQRDNLINKKNGSQLVEELYQLISEKTKKRRDLGDREVLGYLTDIQLKFTAIDKIDEYRIEYNTNFIDDIVDRTGACVFGKTKEEGFGLLGAHYYASLAYILDPNISLLSLNPYYKGKKLDSIGKAILVNTTDEKGEKLLLVDGLILGPDVPIKGDVNAGHWYDLFFENIIKIAKNNDFKKIVFNTSHNKASISQKCVHEFNEYVAHKLKMQRGKEFMVSENEYGIRVFTIPFKKCKNKNGFRYTHELYKKPMPFSRIKIMKNIISDYSGEQYLDAWYPWNEHIAENFMDLIESDNKTARMPYAQKRYINYIKHLSGEKKNPDYAWNHAQGPIRGIEIKLGKIKV